MKRLTITAACTVFVISAAAALASEYDEGICLSQAESEGWENGEALCSCLADAASNDADLSADLAELQAGGPEDRAPENWTPKVAETIDSCSA